MNRGEIVLNDAVSGAVWDVQEDEAEQIDDWEVFAAKKTEKDKDQEEETQREADRRPPEAKPDVYGVRPGRTSVLHPLDNDSAPEGRILSIVSAAQPGNGARVSVSPDGQTLQVATPQRVRPARFDYFVDDGRGKQVSATVTLQPRAAAQNERPTLREGYQPRQWRIPAGGSMSIPVLADWRDDADSDPLLLDSATPVAGTAPGAVARSTAEGRVRFTAPPRADGPIKVRYAVTDGQSAPVPRTMTFLVQPLSDRTGFPPVAEPDVARGEVGRPIEIRPLANDLPGSDPSTPQAELAIGAKLPPQPGAKVATDLEQGVVTFTADKPGTYFLSYEATYGYAPLSRGRIRVDVRPRPRNPADPVAMPDTLMLYGGSPALVDVLANDFDPSGDLLVVQRAIAASSEGQVDVAIIKGRWLRISARSRLAPATQIVRYTVTNGRASATGEVTITQRDQPADNTPVTATDRVIVRAGTAVSAPVLDNDLSPSGDRLSLSTDVTDRPGELDVIAPADYRGEPGHAFVSGRMVRFVPPADLAERESFQVPYTAVAAGGHAEAGRLVVTVIPADVRNTPPEPPTLEGRAVAGDVITLRLPGTDLDREGDPVAITGISSPPRLGRLLSFTANALRYQTYPGSVGTDEFTYTVVDVNGAEATGTVRAAVVPPAAPQPPLAVDDALTVQPSRTATFDPMANDHFVSADGPRLELVQPPEGVSLDEETGLVTVRAPGSTRAPAIQVVYSLSNGIDESRATMTLSTAEDVENPPVIHDAYGDADDSQWVAVDVLDGAYYPDGDAADLRVAQVYAERGTASHTRARVLAERREGPRVIPFRVEDGQGTSSLAQVFVPARGGRTPYVRPGALVEVDAGETFRGSLSDYVVNPSGGPLTLTSRRGVTASPAEVSATAADTGSFAVSARPGYVGPGAVVVEVTTAGDGADSEAADGGSATLLSIPVLVGEDAPVLTCPEAVIPISAGEEKRIDVRSVCQVSTLDPSGAAGLEYDATWDAELSGLDLTPEGGSVFVVSADASATGAGQAVLSVRAGDSNTDQVAFRLVPAPQPRLRTITLGSMDAGSTRTVDLSPHFVPGVPDPTPRILSVAQVGGDRSPVSHDGSSITLRPSLETKGRVEYRVVMTDVAGDDPPRNRTAEGRVVFDVRGVPGAPTAPVELPNEQAGRIRVGWGPPRDTGGSPIRFYEVMELATGDVQRCRQNDCYFKGLEDNRKYRFKVRAHNDVGPGVWSPPSVEAVVDTKPSRVRNVRMVARGSGTITLAWDKPAVTASRIQAYSISWAGGTPLQVTGDQERVTVEGLNNNTSYTFAISALNNVGWSDPRESLRLQPLGTPAAPLNVTVTDQNTGPETTTVRIAWSETSPEGPAPTLYTAYVSVNGGAPRALPGCQRVRVTACTDTRSYDGSVYTYTVRAQNSPSPEPPSVSPPSLGATFDAVGRPAQWGSWSWVATGNNQEVQLSYTVPDSRGDVSRLEILVDGVVKPFGTQRGSAVTRVLVGSNEGPHSVALRVCNEKAPAGCTTSQAQTVQSYGPLTTSLNELGDPQVNGKAVTCTVTGTNNGDAAQLVYRIDEGALQTIDLTGVGAFSQPITGNTDDFAEDIRLQVWLRDASPGGRGEDYARDDARSGVPEPGVTARKGISCTDGDSDPRNNCANGSDPPCEVASCGFVQFTVSGYFESFTCGVNNTEFPNRFGRDYTYYPTYSGSITQDTAWYYPSGTVTVRCIGRGVFGKVATSTFTWPP